MKPHTRNWLRLENKGKPSDTITGEGTIRDHAMMIAEWLLKVHMGSRINITIARTELELSNARGGTPETVSDMMADLESMMGDNVDQSPVCPHGTRLTLHCQDCKREHDKATM